MAHIQKRTYRSHRTGKTVTSWQARYVGPDGKERASRFERKVDAERWLDTNGADIARGSWTDPAAGKQTLRAYAEGWLNNRADIRPTTRAKYRYLLDVHIFPKLGYTRLSNLNPSEIRAWNATLRRRHPSTAAGAYRLLATICRAAVDDERIPRTPCKVKGGGTEVAKERPVASIHELALAEAACPEEYRLAALFAAWCQLRRGEILGLQRRDVDLLHATVMVSRTWALQTDGRLVLGPPKTEAGARTLSIPPHVIPVVITHLEQFVGAENTAWLFEGENGNPVSPRTIDRVWSKARAVAGRPDVRFHDLRHSGLTWSAATGASTAELMRRAGHASPVAAMRYQHATTDRDKVLASALGELAEAAGVVELRRTNDGRSSEKRAAQKPPRAI